MNEMTYRHLLAEPLAIDIRAVPGLILDIQDRGPDVRISAPDDDPDPLFSLLHASGDVAANDLAGSRRGSVVAVVPLAGVITRHGFWARPGTLQLGRALQSLDADPAVGSIVLSVDSPGGTVAGTSELADIVRGIRDRGQTRIVSVADTLMASAATWIGTAADRVYATRSADVGSIGVLNAYTDYSGMLEEAGIKVDVIRTPDKKARFTGVEPLTAAMREELESRVWDAYQEFLSAMADNRGVTITEVEKRFGGGETMGAAAAVKAGMIDGVAALDEVVSMEVVALQAGGDGIQKMKDRRRRALALAEAEGK